MKGAVLGRQEIGALLDALSERLGARGAFAKVHLIGGACMALAYERDHRGWPVEAHETIAAFVEAKRARARGPGGTH